jgi:hypothetical protein
VLEVSLAARDLGMDSALQIRNTLQGRDASGTSGAVWHERQNTRGRPYLIRSGVVFDEQHRSAYYVATAIALDSRDDTLRAVTWTITGLILAAGLLGWHARSLFCVAPCGDHKPSQFSQF